MSGRTFPRQSPGSARGALPPLAPTCRTSGSRNPRVQPYVTRDGLTVMESLSSLALLHDLVQEHRRGGAHVQRFDPPAQRERRRASSHAEATRGRSPRPSEPSTSDDARRGSRGVVRRRARRRRAVAPAARCLGVARGSRRGFAPARPRRCSTAPADALQTAGVTSAERRSGITTPVAPAPPRAAHGAEVLRVGHLVERDDERARAPAAARRRRRRRKADLGAHALVARPSRSALDLGGARRPRTAAPQPRPRAAPLGRPHPRTSRGPRRASRTALRP